MPIRVNNAVQTGGTDYVSPFLGPVNHTVSIAVPIGSLTTAEVDSDGVLKPGVPLLRSGALVSGAGQIVYGVTVEKQKVADGNTGALLTAAGTQQVAVALVAVLQRAIIESNLGRALSANELAALDIAGGGSFTIVA